jgi:Mrp family chromosome partitioning ATPase
MLGGRRKLPVLAEVSGSVTGDARAWSLRRDDLEALTKVRQGLGDHRLVLVVGGEALTGAIALAGAASAAGPRTALVECDLAGPRLALELGLSPGPGLHEYLRWEATAAEILQPLVLAGPAARGVGEPLVCVVAGRPAADAMTLVKLESFRHALAKLRAAYDLTVLVAPPLEVEQGLPEAIAARADTVLAAASPKGLAGQPGRLLRAQVRRLPADAHGAIVVGSG